MNTEFEAVLMTDYEKRWESKPAFWLIRHFFERYGFNFYLSSIKKETREDLENLSKKIKAYLNTLLQ